MVCLGVRIDTHPNLAVRLIRQEWYGADRFDLDPAQPPRVDQPEAVQVSVMHVTETEETSERRPADSVSLDGGSPPESDGLHAIDPDPWADKPAAGLDQTSLGGVPSDIHPGGMLDIFA